MLLSGVWVQITLTAAAAAGGMLIDDETDWGKRKRHRQQEKDACRTYQDQSVWAPAHYLGGRGGFQSLQLTSPTIYNVSGYFLFPPFPYSLRFPTQGY